MRILAICGSIQARSSNQKLLELAATCLPADVSFHYSLSLATLPHFNPDLESEGAVQSVEQLRQEVAHADALVIACPEYGHSLPGVLKNAIDWLIGSGELEGKLIATMASTPSADRGTLGLLALHQTLGAVKARIVGGVPIPRGPNEQAHLVELLKNLYATHRSAAHQD
jgi:chromate reductase, NAD(P)H dehydrogenase (quinone)